ncbi:MAG TPA: nucleoside hydrolase [Nordella sp.]|nr:nucleoside hydrolase [Nordella sp.]
MKAIIDTDPGVDDAMAIFFAASCPEIELIGLTSVYGNIPVEMATRNALHLVEMLGRPIPVAQGMGAPLRGRPWEPVFWIHGEQGFGVLPAPAPKGRAADIHAVDFLVDQAKHHRGELVVFPIGPLTNIAAAIERDPDFARNVAKIVIMGGVVEARGNVTPFAEANIYNDPDAAQIVLNSGAEIVLVGLDVTNRTSLTKEDFAALAKRSPKFGGFLAAIADFYIDVYLGRGAKGCSLHDPATIIAALRPDLFRMEEGDVEVVLAGERLGQTVLTPRQGRKTRVCVEAQYDRVVDVFLEGIARLS